MRKETTKLKEVIIMKEFRYISQLKVRQACIKYDLFTCGGNDSYNDFLNL